MTTAAPPLPVTDLNRRLARLTPEQRELLARRLRSNGSAAVRETPATLPELRLDPDRRHEPFPLTDVQEAYWVGRRSGLELGGVSAHGYIEIDARQLDLPRLQQSFNRLVRRHGMLRAVVDADGRQRVLPETPEYVIEAEDLRGAAPFVQQARLDEIRAHLSHEVLPSDRWPLFSMRASLLNDDVTRVHLSMDVLIFDAWSFDLMSREWEQLYREPQAELPELELSFRDYVLAESAQHACEPYRRSERYWRERLATLPPAPRLPLAKEPALVREPRFVRRTDTLPADEWRALRERAARHAVTPSVALLTAYADVLGAWCNQPRMTVDLTLFNRLPLHPQVNDIVGDFTSVVLLELDHTRPRPFAERARDAQMRLWEDMDHRHFSGVRVLRELARVRGASPAAQMPVVFTSALHHGQEGRHAAALAWMGTTAYTVTQTPQVWLDLQALEHGDRLVLDCDAIEELFPLGLLDDFYGALLGHVRALARDDDSWRRVRPDLLPAAHKQRVARLNATAAEVPAGLLHQPFERQADERPEALAVVSPAARLTYGEVEALANRLAHALRAAGARPETLVGVAMRKGWEQVVAVLGVLKAGAAYLPLDPALPAERFDYLLDHGGVELVLTQRAVEQQRRWPASVRRLVVERDAFEDLPSTRPEARQRPTDLAYVIFTSGSTGLPKGVMIEHRAALNTVADINRRFALQPHDRALGLSSLSFDLSVYDVFGLLAAGAALVLPDPDRLRDPEHWLELIRGEGVSIWNSVPAFLEMLVTCAEGRAGSGIERLRVALLSGDWIPTTLPDRMRALHPAASVVSLGGATEASIWSIVYPVERVEPTWKSIPYGHALLNQAMHVLDAQLETCPPWVTGDIYIGGLGVARGYWRDEPRTQAAFVTHPRTGERLYRTGDLGRYMADGEIEFLGRGDLQVKIQGYRIELGEIEAALMQCPSVRHAVVQAEGDQPAARRLVAYVVAEDAAAERARGNGQAAPGIILDPAERLRFKLSQPGLRRDHAQRVRLALGRRHNGDARDSAYLQRRSVRRFAASSVQAEELGTLLDALSAGEIDGRAKYRYGSAGALYPVQVYAYVAPGRVAGVEAGVYYYHPVQHELVQITPGDVIALEAFDPFNRPMVAQAAFTLFLVADLDAIAPLYGDESREFCLIEAGLISQLLESEAPRHGLGLCQIGGFGFAAVRQHFALGPRHLYLHCVTGGPLPAPGQLATPEGEPAATAHKPAPSDRGQALRDFLRTKLPEYMVPSSYEFVEALPLSANGKVDRQALARLEKEPARKAMEYVPPRSEVERQIAAVWQEVLGVERVGVEDNFFDLGGNSVQMVQIHNRLRRLLQRDFALIDMFVKFPSVRALAEDVVGTAASAPAPAPERGPRHDAHRRRQLEARTAHRRNREHS